MQSKQPTEAQILDALTARGLTRCPHVSAIWGCGGAQLAHSSWEKPSIDVEIPFASAYAILGRTAMSTLTILGREIGKLELKDAAFLVTGHTDAKGSARYNQRLSERRAEAVKRVLIRKFKLSPDMVIAVGYGKMQPKNTADPFAPENRRVQIVTAEVK